MIPVALMYFPVRTLVLLRRLSHPLTKHSVSQTGGTCAYFRTDTFGELKAGGSVAHSVGVLKGFMQAGLTPVYISPHPIKPVIDLDISLRTVKKSAWFRNIPELPLMLYSEQLYLRAGKLFSFRNTSFIYQRYSLNNYTGVLLSLQYHLPFILEYNGSDIWVAKNWGAPLMLEKIARHIENVNLKAADLIVVVSSPLRAELIARGINADKILVNPNGVDAAVYHPGVDGSMVRQRYQFGNKVVAGFIGTFGKWHGAEIFAAAIKDIVQKNDSVHFLFIGDGMTMPLVREIIDHDRMEKHVTFSGLVPQEDAPKYLAACDMLISPHIPNPDGSPFFGSPTKLFEYMAMGKAIVASDLDQIGEVLENGKTAIMVNPGDLNALADAVLRLAGEKEQRERLGRNARATVLERYTWKEHVRKIIERLEAKARVYHDES